METIIYYRPSLFKEELPFASKYFTCTSSLSEIPANSLTVPRFSMWPFFKDQENEIKSRGSQCINSYAQSRYIADLQNYVMDIGELTPRTWTNLHEIPEEGPFVLKGETNSKKGYWNTMMFASNKKEAIEVHGRLCADSLIGEQNIYIRQYVPLITYTKGIGGIPITKEFRFFVMYGQVIYGSYYWSNYVDELPEVPNVNDVPKEFLEKIIKIVGNKSNFYVIDVAQTQAGNWIVIELNDGISAGLPDDNFDEFYSNIKKIIDVHKA